MIEGRWFPQGADISQAIALRQAVFGRGRDSLDALAQQVVVYREGAPVGTARLRWEDGLFRADGVCVLPAERGKGYGDLLIRLLLYKAATHGGREVAVLSPAAAAPFFLRCGFVAVSQGDPVEMRASVDGPCAGCRGCGD